MSSDFTLYIPTVSPQLKYKNLNLKKPLLYLNTFMNLLERRIQDLDSKARSTSWTRNVGPTSSPLYTCSRMQSFDAEFSIKYVDKDISTRWQRKCCVRHEISLVRTNTSQLLLGILISVRFKDGNVEVVRGVVSWTRYAWSCADVLHRRTKSGQ